MLTDCKFNYELNEVLHSIFGQFVAMLWTKISIFFAKIVPTFKFLGLIVNSLKHF